VAELLAPNRGGATGMATMATAIALSGLLWPLIALAITHWPTHWRIQARADYAPTLHPFSHPPLTKCRGWSWLREAYYFNLKRFIYILNFGSSFG